MDRHGLRPRDDESGAVIAIAASLPATACGLAAKGFDLAMMASAAIHAPEFVIASEARRSIVEKSGFMDCRALLAMTAGSWKAKRGNPSRPPVIASAARQSIPPQRISKTHI